MDPRFDLGCWCAGGDVQALLPESRMARLRIIDM
jgi:hypothetical protein